MRSRTGVPEAIAAASAAFSTILDADPGELSAQGLLDALKVLQPVLNRAQAAQVHLAGAVHTRGAVVEEGGVSTPAWLRNRLHLGNAGVVVRAAATMARLERVAAAFAAGEIGLDHVEIIGVVARDLSDEVLAAGAEKLLVEQACELAPGAFAKAAITIRDHFNPDAADDRIKRRLKERWFRADHTFEGWVSLQGMLDPESGELLLTTLNAFNSPPRFDDQRTAGNRGADALLDLCRAASVDAPVAGGEKPHVVVTIDHNVLAGRVPGVGVLGSGWPVPLETVRRLACDCGVIPLLLGSKGEPLDIGRLSRAIPPPMRRALVHRDGGCRFPACDRPASWCDAHHVNRSWFDGGDTALSNLILVCRFHHTLLHEGQWTAELDPDTGTVRVWRPDGTLLDVTHPRSQSP